MMSVPTSTDEYAVWLSAAPEALLPDRWLMETTRKGD
jgi:hypothetical protein